MSINYGWYSDEQRRMYGSFIYRRADGNGTIEVTCVTRPGEPGPLFPDVVAVGELGAFVGRGYKGAVQVAHHDTASIFRVRWPQ